MSNQRSICKHQKSCIQMWLILFYQYVLINFMQLGDIQTVIFDRGCLRSGEEWVERNLVPVAGVAVALAVLQVWQSLYHMHSTIHTFYFVSLILHYIFIIHLVKRTNIIFHYSMHLRQCNFFIRILIKTLKCSVYSMRHIQAIGWTNYNHLHYIFVLHLSCFICLC